MIGIYTPNSKRKIVIQNCTTKNKLTNLPFIHKSSTRNYEIYGPRSYLKNTLQKAFNIVLLIEFLKD